MKNKFYFSIIRIVPDPVKFEPVNVGVVVVSADGAIGDLLYNKRIRSRLTPYRLDFPLGSIFATIDDLRQHLGLDTQLALGGAEPSRSLRGFTRLEAAAR